MAMALRLRLYLFSDGQPIKYHIPEDFVDDLTSTNHGDSWIHHAHTISQEHALFQHMAVRATLPLTLLVS